MTKEEKLWFQQLLNGSPIDRASFIRGLEYLLPDTEEGAASIWADFARERVEAGQYVRFAEEPYEAALCSWHDTLLAGFALLTERFGRDTAEKVCGLSLSGCCLYPWEMDRAAEELRKGTTPDMVSHLMREGKLEADDAVFPRLKEALDAVEPSEPSQERHMNITF